MRSLHTAPATAERAGPQRRPRAPQPLLQSLDTAERARPLRREPGPPRRPRAPQPLLQSLDSAPATAERAGPPAATTRAAAPSAVSGHCGESRAPAERAGPPAATTRAAAPSAVSAERAEPLRREPGPSAATTHAAAPSAVSGHCAGHCGESRAPSGDHSRRSPFCSLWTLRREPGPQRRPRAPQPLLQSLDTAPATAERAGPPAATTRAAAPSAVPPSGDHARRSPFCSLWTLRRESGPQRRPHAPQPLLQSLDTAERAGPPAATTRAAAPSAVSGHCAGHCGESRAPSGDHARRSPFCSLWTLGRELGPQRRPRAPQSLDTAERAGPPAATTRAAAPSAVSGHCAEWICEMRRRE